MGKKRILQAGGSKEAPLAIVTGSGIAPAPDTSPTLEESEQQYYQELFKSFFEKIIKWDTILEDERYEDHQSSYDIITTSDRHRYFQVLQTQAGLVISNLDPLGENGRVKIRPEKVLTVSRTVGLNHPKHNLFKKEFNFKPGPAGEQFFVDPDGRPLDSATFTVNDQRPVQGPVYTQTLEIRIEYAKYTDTMVDRYKGVEYELANGPVQATRTLFFPLMTDAYATHLFNTIDRLIPGAPTTPQPGRRATHELVPPRQLPAPGRRPAGR